LRAERRSASSIKIVVLQCAEGLEDERFSRDGGHGFEHALVGDAVHLE